MQFFSSKTLSLAARIGLTLLAFWFVFRDVDFNYLDDILRAQDHTMLVTAALLILCQIALGALRWRLILAALADGKHVLSWMESLRIYYISVFFNCCLPGTVGGDVVRVWLTKSDHVALPLAINSVIIDRIIALAGLGVLVIATLPLLGDAAGFDALPFMLLAVVATAAGLRLMFNLERLLARFQEWRVLRWLLYFVSSLRLLFVHRMASVVSLAYAVIAHVSFCIAAYVLAKSLGAPLTIAACITLIPPVLLAITLPVSIGGWGVREAGMVSMLALAGVPQATALMLSIQLGLLNILVSLPAGLLWLLYRKRG